VTDLALNDNNLTSLPVSIIQLNLTTHLSLYNNRLCNNVEPSVSLWAENYTPNSWYNSQTSDGTTACTVQINSCTDQSCDNSVVRAILDANGLTNELVSSVATYETTGALRVTGLNIENKGLQVIPPVIGALNKLEDLDLHSNILESLPAQIGQLSSLKTLNLEENNLLKLPNDIVNLVLESSSSVRLHGNHLCTMTNNIKNWAHTYGFDSRNYFGTWDADQTYDYGGACTVVFSP